MVASIGIAAPKSEKAVVTLDNLLQIGLPEGPLPEVPPSLKLLPSFLYLSLSTYPPRKLLSLQLELSTS